MRMASIGWSGSLPAIAKGNSFLAWRLRPFGIRTTRPQLPRKLSTAAQGIFIQARPPPRQIK